MGTRGPKPGGPLGHGARCGCSEACRAHRNADAREWRAKRAEAVGGRWVHGRLVLTPPAERDRYGQVAQVAREAQATGGSMLAAVAEAFGTTRSAAAATISRARAAGHEIPDGRRSSPRPRRVPPARPAPAAPPRKAVTMPEPDDDDDLPALPPTGSWAQRSACHGLDPSLFFPGRGDNLTLRAAKAVCAGCPVRQDCADYAVDHGIKFGVWGGLSERERRRMRRALRLAVAS